MKIQKDDEYNKQINIVIPMAGEGKRYTLEGYTIPKPFIEINNKMMIELVLDSFKNINAIFTIVIQKKFLVEQKLQLEKLKQRYKIKIVTVPKLTMGAAITALAAHKSINPKYDIIFADSDNFFNPKDISDFIIYVRKRDLKGALLTFKSFDPAFSYVKSDEQGYLIKTKEKEAISQHAICGLYYFKNLEDFKSSVIDLIVESDISKGEFYMSNIYNHLKKLTNKIGIYEIKNFNCVGTPKQLKEYLNGGTNDQI